MVNLCMVNEDSPQCNVLRKTIKAFPGGGQGFLSNLESGHAAPFLHRISVVHVYVCLNTETSTADLAGWDLHHLETVLHQLTAGTGG